MQNASRRPAQLCKAGRAGAVHNNDDIELAEKQGLRNKDTGPKKDTGCENPT